MTVTWLIITLLNKVRKMRELSVVELNAVAGGGNFFGSFSNASPTVTSTGIGDSLLGAAAMGTTLASYGMTIGGTHGGDGGGIVGLGQIGQLVGLIIPTIQGAIVGTVLGAIYGLSGSQPLINQLVQGWANGTAGQAGNAAAVRI